MQALTGTAASFHIYIITSRMRKGANGPMPYEIGTKIYINWNWQIGHIYEKISQTNDSLSLVLF